jgi:antitoxin MazE
MRTVVKKWGNSAYVRIPAAVMHAANLELNLELNDAVDVREESGRIVIEPIRGEYDLDALLKRITRKNLHEEVEFGALREEKPGAYHD